MLLKLYLQSILEELILEYEQQYSSRHFTLKKLGNEIIFIDINNALLQSIHQTEADFIGKPVHTAFCLKSESEKKKLKEAYLSVWSGKKILHYYYPYNNPNIFLVVYSEPKFHKNEVIQIIGRCACFSKENLPEMIEFTCDFIEFD